MLFNVKLIVKHIKKVKFYNVDAACPWGDGGFPHIPSELALEYDCLSVNLTFEFYDHSDQSLTVTLIM